MKHITQASLFRKLDQRLTRRLIKYNMVQLLSLPRRLLCRGNFVIFHIGRSGSTVLWDLLVQHPDIVCDGELFHCYYGEEIKEAQRNGDTTKWRWDESPFFPDQPVAFLRSRLPRAGLRRYYGLETKFFHIRFNGLTLAQYIDELIKLDFTHFIILERKNTLRVITSSTIAQSKKEFHFRKTPDRPHSVHLDVNNVRNDGEIKPLMEYLTDYRDNFELLEKLVSGRNVLHLTYEDDISSDPQRAFMKIVEFLGLDPSSVTVRYQKANPFAIRDLLDNYNEVSEYLKGSEFEWMLERSNS